jgi:hypothetical protein
MAEPAAPAPPRPETAPERPNTGRMVLTLAGPILLVLSCAFAQFGLRFPGSENTIPRYAIDFSLMGLLVPGPDSLRVPTLGLLLMLVGIVGLLSAGSGGTATIIRRVLGALVLALLAVQLFRQSQFLGGTAVYSFPGSLRAGLYLALLGGLLMLLGPGPAPGSTAPPRGGAIWSAAGWVAVLLGATAAWFVQPFGPEGVDPGVPPTVIRVAAILSPRLFEIPVPTVAQVLVVGGLVAAVGLLLRPGSVSLEVTRRVIGGVVLLLAGLFAWRMSQAFTNLPPGEPTFPTNIRVAFFLTVVGGFLLLLAPRWRPGATREPEPASAP